MANTESYQEILVAAKAEKERLESLQRGVNTEINRIRKASVSLSAADQTRIDELRGDMNALLDGITALALVTIEKLDKTDEVRDLVDQLRRVRQDLEGRRDRLIRFGQKVEAAGDALQGFAKLVEKISKTLDHDKG